MSNSIVVRHSTASLSEGHEEVLTCACLQGGLYSSIIDDVISAARADFQEEGVDEATLQDFRNVSPPFVTCLDRECGDHGYERHRD